MPLCSRGRLHRDRRFARLCFYQCQCGVGCTKTMFFTTVLHLCNIRHWHFLCFLVSNAKILLFTPLRCRVRPHQGHKVSYAQAGLVLSFFRFFFPSLFFSFSSICLSFALSLLFFFCFFLSFFPSLLVLVLVLVVVVVVVPGQIF